jgi:hypothetical protein
MVGCGDRAGQGTHCGRMGRLRSRALTIKEVLGRGEHLELASAVDALLKKGVCCFPSELELKTRWHRVVTELAALDGGCDGGALLALLYDDLADLESINTNPIDGCVAAALKEALKLRLLPATPGFPDAVETLETELMDNYTPDDGVVLRALWTVVRGLRAAVESDRGGSAAEVLLDWLQRRPY